MAAAFLFTAGPGTARAASLFDPALRFRTIATAHFVIYYHQNEDAQAIRLSQIAEETWRTMASRLSPAPPSLTHVVIADDSELANGFATPLPRDTIVITAVWPSGSEYIGNTDDWLRLVFTHEFTHIVHLDRSESWAGAVRAVFGRMPLAFPNLFLPVWQIEGLATYEESAITGEGRLHAGDFRQITDVAARRRTLEPLDRVNGGLTDWPGGLGAYAYGLGFHAYLAETYGDGKLAELAERTARRVPYTASRAFKSVYGKPLGDLWRDYERSLNVPQRAAPSPSVERLTHHGFYVSGPRFDRASCDACGPRLIYSIRTPHGFPSLNRIDIDGTRPTRLTTRYLGSTLGIAASTVVFDQQEVRRNAGVYSDLYALDTQSGRVRPLTRDARLVDPDLSPDGALIVAARQVAPGTRSLVEMRLTADPRPPISTLIAEPDAQFNAPRWSPDGRLVAAERHRRGFVSDVVVVDAATHELRAVIARDATRVVTPAWRSDGQAVIVAAASEDRPFQLYEVPLGGHEWRQLTDVDGGALWPESSPDGATLVFVGYTTDGFDLFKTAYPSRPSALTIVAAPTDVHSESAAAPRSIASGAANPYTPWPTLPPTSWSPIVTIDRRSVRLGAAVGGADVLGYHAYAAAATWRLTTPDGAIVPSAAAPDWQVSYAYTRWRPIFYGIASLDTSFFAGPPAESGEPSQGTLREQSLEAGVILPFQHVRTAHTALASIVAAHDDFTFGDKKISEERSALRGGWATTTAHVFGYSISPERGVAAGVTIERVDRRIGASADATAVTGDVRLYVPSVREHDVLAFRVAGGASSGDPNLRRTFLLGGAGPNLEPLDFGSEAASLLRGYPLDSFAGRRVALLNAEYRFAIARPQRGLGTWPIFLHTFHGAAFADVGNVWTRRFSTSDIKTSVGGELSLDLIAGYFLPFTVTIGAARGHDGSGLLLDATTIYARVGRSF